MTRHLLLVPSLACPAECKYCFGPHQRSGIMNRSTIEVIVKWQKSPGKVDILDITFHGGEPLTAGIDFYHMALPLLKNSLLPVNVRFGIQSNLWLLTDELCELFLKYNVSIGTSLDGPEHINDRQRGNGYFRCTMEGIKLARRYGISCGCICTFTSKSISDYTEIFNFFMNEGINFTIHPAVPSLKYKLSDYWTLSQKKYGELFVNLLKCYLSSLDKIRISTLDSMIRSVSFQRGEICTFSDCLGNYLAVGPEGNIYPCQRFAGVKEYRMGNVNYCQSASKLSSSHIWQIFKERQQHIKEECGDCFHFDYCRGGCPYNALAENGGVFKESMRDRYCPAYKRLFSVIIDMALEEFFSNENMDAVVQSVDPYSGLLRCGRLISIIRDGTKSTHRT